MRVSNWSLTAQLGALFAFISVFVFSVLGIYLYQALVSQLQERDDTNLVECILFIRHVLEETADVDSIRLHPHRFLEAVNIHGEFSLLIQAKNREILVRNNVQYSFTDAAAPIPAAVIPEPSHVRNAVQRNEQNLRVIRALGSVGATGTEVTITLARSSNGLAAVLATYRLKVVIAGLIGAVLTALLGFIVVRCGLGKVKLFAGQAQQITAHNLEIRLDAQSAPAELRVLADSFNEVLNRLQSSLNNLSEFAGDLAHDLRTPLNNLMVQTEVVLSQPRETEEYQNLLSSNYEEFGRLARMVESMLFLARADHDQVALSTEQLDAHGELTRITEYFEGPASEAGVLLLLIATGTVHADAHLLRRAVSNLVSNAIRYTTRGNTIVLRTVADQDGVHLSVSNTGPSIVAEDLPRLFDRFYRSDKSRSSISASAGLGLAIVKSIMSLHHGSAQVQSEQDGVTTFTLFFPSASASVPSGNCRQRQTGKTFS